MKRDVNPMHSAPRCQAKSKRSGLQCQSPAVKGKRVCRMHGAKAGAPFGTRNGNWRHGARQRDFEEMLREVRELGKHLS